MGRGGRQHERHPAVRIGDGRDPGGCIGDHRIVERPDLRQHVERMQRRGRLALGRAHVGLEGVTEAAVGIAVRAQRIEDGCDRRAVQEHGQPVPVEQPRVGEDEPLGGADVDHHGEGS